MLLEFTTAVARGQQTLRGHLQDWGERSAQAVRTGIRHPYAKAYLLLAATTLILPLIYAFVLYPDIVLADYETKHELHIALNVGLNVVCGVIALRSRGNLAHRLMAGVVGVGIAYGIFLLVILGFRLYYSRAIMVASILASIAIVTLFTMLMERLRTRRIAIVPQGLDLAQLEWVPGGTLVSSPDAPTHTFDLVLINWSSALDPRWIGFVARAVLSGCEVQHFASHVEDRRGRVMAEQFEAVHATGPQNSPYIMSYKRMFDIAIVVLTTPIVLPILVVASGLICRTMGGPVLFTQPRIGIGGREFRMYKLRTMRPGEPGDDATATAVGDPRITPLGKILRRYRIDELPQFYNILKGDMSLVGPRPEQPVLARSYAVSVPGFNYRTMLRPGLTGWAQVRSTYAADETETAEKIAYDLYYVKHASFVMDLSIMVQTVKTLITGNSAR